MDTSVGFFNEGINPNGGPNYGRAQGGNGYNCQDWTISNGNASGGIVNVNGVTTSAVCTGLRGVACCI
jgi:hypothetical protein